MPENSPITPIKIELPDSIDTALKNITDKPSSAVGNTIADIWFLVMGGISHAAEKRKMKYSHALEQYKKELISSIEKIPEDKRIEPSTQIVAQALEKSKYCVEEETLRKMFVNLISNSASIDYSSKAHPSFADIINQMSPLDASVLMLLSQHSHFAIVNFMFDLHPSGHEVYKTNIFLANASKEEIDMYSVSIESLERLGLISVTYADYLLGDDKYSIFENGDAFLKFKHDHPITSKNNASNYKGHSIKKGYTSITSFGQNFIDVCC